MPRKTYKEKIIADLRRQLKLAKKQKDRPISATLSQHTNKADKPKIRQKIIDVEFDFAYLGKDLLKIGLLSLTIFIVEIILFLKLEKNYF